MADLEKRINKEDGWDTKNAAMFGEEAAATGYDRGSERLADGNLSLFGLAEREQHWSAYPATAQSWQDDKWSAYPAAAESGQDDRRWE